jgi:hypothetical protein
MNSQRVPSGSDVTELKIFFEALFAGTWVADGR